MNQIESAIGSVLEENTEKEVGDLVLLMTAFMYISSSGNMT